MVASMAVLIAIVLVTGEPITLEWLLRRRRSCCCRRSSTPGLAMVVARLGSKVTDIKQLIPFIMRIWMYGSGVLYPVQRFTDHLTAGSWQLVEANPLLVYIELMRHALMEDVQLANPLEPCSGSRPSVWAVRGRPRRLRLLLARREGVRPWLTPRANASPTVIVDDAHVVYRVHGSATPRARAARWPASSGSSPAPRPPPSARCTRSRASASSRTRARRSA